MKRIVIASCLFLFLFTTNQVIAQEKVKIKDDSSKVKMKDDKTKIKDDNYKEKDKDGKTKIKDDNFKEKDKDGKIKIKDENGKMKIKTGDGMNITYPYTANYSSKFVMGNPAHAKMVLDLWKDWDDNAFDRHENYFADTLVMYLPDGSVVKGKAANMEGAKKYRGGMSSAKSTIDAWMPLRSTDRNEDWVAVWGSETDTWADGKTETRQIHEIWKINKDGKIAVMWQYSALPEKKQ